MDGTFHAVFMQLIYWSRYHLNTYANPIRHCQEQIQLRYWILSQSVMSFPLYTLAFTHFKKFAI